jgi:glutamate-ammonia-ligase adenylyltransferase
MIMTQSDSPEAGLSAAMLSAEDLLRIGFTDTESALRCLKRIFAWWRESNPAAAECSQQPPAWYTALLRILQEAPLKETVLQSVEDYLRNARQQFDAFALFNQSPRAIEIIARLACTSPFLSRTLQADPLYLTELTLDGRTADTKDREQFVTEAGKPLKSLLNQSQRLVSLRRYQRRELLRIGICDAFGLMDLRFITLQLSLLADAMVQCCLQEACKECNLPEEAITVIALGKLGGEELNYSSDIDLALVTKTDAPGLQRLAQSLINGLTANLAPGFLYRVDLRLRPWGDAGPLVSTTAAYRNYLQTSAELWEKQAMLKARVIAGHADTGKTFLTDIRPLLFTQSPAEVLQNVQSMKDRIEARLRKRGRLTTEVKLGAGSIRDIEFLVQSLQLMHGAEQPWIVSPNTLDALVRLTEFGHINALRYRQLRSGYIFLRTIEHSLQLLHNQQTHELPKDIHQLEWLAFRLDYPDSVTFMERFEEHRRTVRAIFERSFSPAEQSAAPDPAIAASQRTAVVPAPADTHTATADDQLRSLLALVDDHGGCRVQVHPLTPDSRLLKLVIAGASFPGWLSVICGLLSIHRLDIRSGDATTEQLPSGQLLPEGLFTTSFILNPTADSPLKQLETLLQQEIVRLGELSRAQQLADVRNELISRFCAGVVPAPPRTAIPAETEISVELIQHDVTLQTELRIEGDDSQGFLYELFNALSLSQFRVQRAVIRSDGVRVSDRIFVREPDGTAVLNSERQEELRIAATLIKQFTHWLPSSSEPWQALLNFRELVARMRPDQEWEQQVQSLQKPGVLPNVARVLGMSQYLWTTFLRLPQQELLPLITSPQKLSDSRTRPELDAELMTLLADAGPQTWLTLNQFKDRQLFRIEMRHVLGLCRPFGAFSRELTDLAESIIHHAVQIAWEELRQQFGNPVISGSGALCPWTIAAMGKFGGIELGFASDIELLLLYESEGQTSGPHSVSNSEFFERIIRLLSRHIEAPQDGIFQLDLRMRPYGQAGPAAVMLDNLVEYFSPAGPAWPFERQALVRFRPFTGPVDFQDKASKSVARICYELQRFDFDSMHAMRERQIRQLVRAGSINAKLSEGGLVDCEYSVQALQLVWGNRYPKLQHPNTLEVLRQAATAGLISTADSERVSRACMFLRELIDCLRMVRGNARDLNVPQAETRAWHTLSRRMQLLGDSDTELRQLEEEMSVIRSFFQHIRSLIAAAEQV